MLWVCVAASDLVFSWVVVQIFWFVSSFICVMFVSSFLCFPCSVFVLFSLSTLIVPDPPTPISCTLSSCPCVSLSFCRFVVHVPDVPCFCLCLARNIFFVVVLFCFVFASLGSFAFCWTVLSVAPAYSACCPCLQVQTLFFNLDRDNLHPSCPIIFWKVWWGTSFVQVVLLWHKWLYIAGTLMQVHCSFKGIHILKQAAISS